VTIRYAAALALVCWYLMTPVGLLPATPADRVTQTPQIIENEAPTAEPRSSAATAQKTPHAGSDEPNDAQVASGAQEKTIKVAIPPIEIQRDRFDLSAAFFNCLLVVVTVFQFALLLLNFQTQYRPHLGIRQLTLENDFDSDPDVLFKDSIVVGLYAVNRGATAARVVEGNITIVSHRSDRPPRSVNSMAIPYDSEHGLLKGKRIKSATQHLMRKDHPPLPRASEDDFKTGKISIFVIGYFRYRDVLRRHYRTAFCRRFHSESGQFIAMGDRDSEYED